MTKEAEMNAEFLQRVIARDLTALREQVRAYEREEDLWVCPDGIPNSAGTLVLHLVGNMQHFIGAQLGNTGYVRDREAEFSARNVARADLETGIQQAVATVNATFEQLEPSDLEQEFPLELAGCRLTTGLFMTHLATHLAYHLGQIDYHRRVVTKRSEAAGAQSIPALVGE
jgi:uncharacterized damage-inducible protein DinB